MDNTKNILFDALEDPSLLEGGATEAGISRRGALRRSGLLGAGLAALTLPGAMTALASRAFAQGAALPPQIVNALNIAYLLERLEAEFYRLGLAASGLIPAADRTIFAQISKHEDAHVAFLAGVLGSNAARIPQFDFTAGGQFDTFTNYETFKLLAQGFEDFGVRAYKGQAGNLASNKAVLTAALRIHSVEARHASEVRRLRGLKGWIPNAETPAPALAAVYAGEENTIQLGIDVSTYLGATAGSEAFDEPVTDVFTVYGVAKTFFRQ
jgi:hypothetical protein